MKKHNKTVYAALLLASTGLGAVGQVLFKVAVVSAGHAIAEYLLLGLAVYALSTIIYFYVLSRSHLSWAYGFAGLSFVFASIIAGVLGESVPLARWVGIGIITLGTALIGLS
jgi:uncharacterized membrane protein